MTESNPSRIITVHVTISGEVQGVSFRASMRDEAERVGVAGWVRNRADGTVEAHLQGPRPNVERLLEWAQRGPPAARVDRLSTEWNVPAERDASSFVVRT